MTKKSYIQAITDALDIMLKEDPKTLKDRKSVV